MENQLTINQEFKNALNLVQFTSQSFFLTGKAGTGKSTFLRHVCATTKKQNVVLAPTGIAAINAGGSTLHSFFKLPFHPLVPDDPRFAGRKLRDFLKYNRQQCKLLKELELIIIDEVSMVRADIIDFVDRILRTYSGNTRQPFGGKQMLFVGDIYQLEPVVTRDERDILSRFYESPFFFSAHVFKEMQLVSVELTQVFRQTDRAFITILDHIRCNAASDADLQLLNMHVASPAEAESPDPDADSALTITLAARRDTVDSINRSNLSELPGESCFFKGEIKADFPENSLPTLLELELKVGAQVIFVKNDREKRWVNGTLGIVTAIDEGGKSLYVRTDEDKEYEVERTQWENVRYSYNEQEKKIEEELLGVFIQFPVRLAWAITIHKSQGLTFDRVNVDFSGGVFAGGQTYVALSRCRTLEGLCLQQPVSRSDIFVNPNIVEFAKQFNNQHAVDVALRRAAADIQYHDAAVAFDAGDFETCIEQFIQAMHSRYDVEKPWVRRLIRRKLGIVNVQRSQIQALQAQLKCQQEEMDEKQRMLNKLAVEYIRLAEQSVEMDDAKSAISNYDKALSLNPQSVDAMVGKARVLLSQRRLQKALKTINAALELAPHHFKSLYLRGKILYQMRELELAAAALERCTSMKPKNISSHILLGDILAAAGDEDGAAVQYAIAERLKASKK